MLAIILTFILSPKVQAADSSSQLFKLETENATIFTELIIEGERVIRESTASRTSYAYNQFESERLANVAMGIRSQNYNSRDGYSHFYSILPNKIEELLEIDYKTANESLLATQKIGELLNAGFIKTDRYPAEADFILEGDLYVSGNIVLEYADSTVFKRVELDYIGERIFIMTSIQEPTLEYYGFDSIDAFVNNREAHKYHVNGKGYTYSYFVDGGFLGETTEIRYYLMEPKSYFMNLYQLTEEAYYERYPQGVDSVAETVNDYLSRGFEITRHVNNSPHIDYKSDIDFAQMYEDAVANIEETEREEEIETPDETVEESTIEDEGTVLDDLEQDETSEETIEEEQVINIPPPSLDVYTQFGDVATYQRTNQDSHVTLKFVHVDGVISHVLMNHNMSLINGESQLDEVRLSQQFLSEMPGYESGVVEGEGNIEVISAIDFTQFQIPESFIPLAHESLPVYMDYSLVDVHQELLATGYVYSQQEIGKDTGTIVLEHASEGRKTLFFEAGIFEEESEAESEKPINDVVLELIQQGYVIISIE